MQTIASPTGSGLGDEFICKNWGFFKGKHACPLQSNIDSGTEDCGIWALLPFSKTCHTMLPTSVPQESFRPHGEEARRPPPPGRTPTSLYTCLASSSECVVRSEPGHTLFKALVCSLLPDKCSPCTAWGLQLRGRRDELGLSSPGQPCSRIRASKASGPSGCVPASSAVLLQPLSSLLHERNGLHAPIPAGSALSCAEPRAQKSQCPRPPQDLRKIFSITPQLLHLGEPWAPESLLNP